MPDDIGAVRSDVVVCSGYLRSDAGCEVFGSLWRLRHICRDSEAQFCDRPFPLLHTDD